MENPLLRHDEVTGATWLKEVSAYTKHREEIENNLSIVQDIIQQYESLFDECNTVFESREIPDNYEDSSNNSSLTTPFTSQFFAPSVTIITDPPTGDNAQLLIDINKCMPNIAWKRLKISNSDKVFFGFSIDPSISDEVESVDELKTWLQTKSQMQLDQVTVGTLQWQILKNVSLKVLYETNYNLEAENSTFEYGS